jgi:Domain of unknown function (DUF1877)
MPTICRLIQLTPDQAATLTADPELLAKTVGTAKRYCDVYRYWDGIRFLLAQHRPGSAAARWLELGTPVSAPTADLPAARVLTPDHVAELAHALQDIQPDDLAAHYDAGALDQAGVYPNCWREWEETFDPLGQVLEHYSFLQSIAAECGAGRTALLLRFEFLEDGSV